VTAHDHLTRRLLMHLEAGRAVSQRSLARDLRIALGLTNQLLRRLVANGWVEMTREGPHHARYAITPAGIEQERVISRAYFEHATGFYAETRDRIRRTFALVSSSWPCEPRDGNVTKPIVFYGAGEVAEIGYVSLQDTDLRLVGVVDEDCARNFFGLPVRPPCALATGEIDGCAFGRLVVMSFQNLDEIQSRLDALRFPADRVCWV
jgi:DNA-binding MarR family transcriptional regulator